MSRRRALLLRLVVGLGLSVLLGHWVLLMTLSRQDALQRAAAPAARSEAQAAAAAWAAPPSAAPTSATTSATSRHAMWLAPRVTRAGGSALRAAVIVTGTPGALTVLTANHAWGLSCSGRVLVDLFLALSAEVRDPDSLEGRIGGGASRQDALSAASGAYREALLAAGVALAHVSAEPDKPPRADVRRVSVAKGSSHLAVVGQLSSMACALRALRAHEAQHGFQYDVVARMRTDIVFVAPLGPLLSRAAEERAARAGAGARCFVPRWDKYLDVHDRVTARPPRRTLRVASPSSSGAPRSCCQPRASLLAQSASCSRRSCWPT
jgi:hypothetical protein